MSVDVAQSTNDNRQQTLNSPGNVSSKTSRSKQGSASKTNEQIFDGISRKSFETGYCKDGAQGGMLNKPSDETFYWPQMRAKQFAQWIVDRDNENEKKGATELLVYDMESHRIEAGEWPFPAQVIEEVKKLADDPSQEPSSKWYTRTKDGVYHEQHDPPASGSKDYPHGGVDDEGNTDMGEDSLRDHVEPICTTEEVSTALEAVLNEPKSKKLAQDLDGILNSPLKKLRKDGKVNVDLTLDISALRANFMQYSVDIFAIDRLPAGTDKDQAQTRISGAQEWFVEVVQQKAYPNAWIDKFLKVAEKHKTKAQSANLAPFSRDDIHAVFPEVRKDKDLSRFAPKNTNDNQEQGGGFSGGVTSQDTSGPDNPSPKQTTQPSHFANSINVTTAGDRTIANEEICGWRPWGASSFRFIVRVNDAESVPAICRFKAANKKDVDAYKESGNALEIPSVEEVDPDDLRVLRGCDPELIKFGGIAIQRDPNIHTKHNQTLVLFRIEGEGPSQRVRMVWGRQFGECVKDAKALIRRAYNIGMGNGEGVPTTSDKPTSVPHRGAINLNKSPNPPPEPKQPETDEVVALKARLEEMEKKLLALTSEGELRSAQKEGSPATT